MDLHIREQLAELAEKLHLYRGDSEDKATELGSEVQAALDEEDSEDHADLSGRLAERAADFENDHPDLALAIRRVADAISASGI